MCFIVFYIPLFCFSPGSWKRKKILFLSPVPVKSFQKTFQRKFLGSVTSWRSEVVRSRQNLPSHLPGWERCLTTSAPCSCGRPAYEACCRSKTRPKSTSPELGHDRGVGGSLCFTAFFSTGSKKLHVMSGNNHFKRWVTAVSKQSGDREKNIKQCTSTSRGISFVNFSLAPLWQTKQQNKTPTLKLEVGLVLCRKDDGSL